MPSTRSKLKRNNEEIDSSNEDDGVVLSRSKTIHKNISQPQQVETEEPLSSSVKSKRNDDDDDDEPPSSGNSRAITPSLTRGFSVLTDFAVTPANQKTFDRQSQYSNLSNRSCSSRFLVNIFTFP